MANLKTHKVIDVDYPEEENNEVFNGTFEECHEWKKEQANYHPKGFGGYIIVALNRNEMLIYNKFI